MPRGDSDAISRFGWRGVGDGDQPIPPYLYDATRFPEGLPARIPASVCTSLPCFYGSDIWPAGDDLTHHARRERKDDPPDLRRFVLFSLDYPYPPLPSRIFVWSECGEWTVVHPDQQRSRPGTWREWRADLLLNEIDAETLRPGEKKGRRSSERYPKVAFHRPSTFYATDGKWRAC
jgi:hypothetical protein